MSELNGHQPEHMSVEPSCSWGSHGSEKHEKLWNISKEEKIVTIVQSNSCKLCRVSEDEVSEQGNSRQLCGQSPS